MKKELRSMHCCSQFASNFAARTGSGTSDCLEAIVPPVKPGRVASSGRRASLNPKISMCVRYQLARGIHVNVGGSLGPDFAAKNVVSL